MLKIFTYLFLLVGVSSYSQSVAWLVDYDEAISLAKDRNTNVLIYFTGSDWCGPCKKLKKDFLETNEFVNMSKNIVLLKLDYPRNLDLISPKEVKENKKLLIKYNFNKTFPKMVIVNQKGNIKGEESGYGMLRDHSPYTKLISKYIR